MGFLRCGTSAAFYLYLLEPPPWLAAAAIVVLAALSFVPIRFVHPLRVRHMRAFNIMLLTAWAVLAGVAVIQNLSPGPYVTWPLSVIAVYFFTAGLLRRPA